MLSAYAVHRYDRRTRRVLEVLAEGLDHRAASLLAQTLRNDDRDNEDAHGYTVATLPLHRQAELAEAAGLMLAAADPAPYALAA